MRLNTTGRQSKALDALMAQLCELYNMALQQRRDVWRSHRKTFSFYDQQKQLTELRAGVDEYREFAHDIQKDPLRRLDRAFAAFFRRTKSGQIPGFPRFRSASKYDSFTVNRANFRLDDNGLRIVRLGTFGVKTRCRMRGIPVHLTVKRCGSKWLALVTCDLGVAPDLVAISSATGIDLGITYLATLSDGSEIPNPRWTRKEEHRLASANRALSRKKKGSKNRSKAREKLRRTYRRIAGLRDSHLTLIAKQLISRYDLIAHEDLKISKMVQSKLAKSILDAAWRQLIWRLKCEAEKAGVTVIAVNPRNTSQACSGCGVLVPKTLSQRQHDCVDCGLSLGRDHNAALNILRLGRSHVETQKVDYAVALTVAGLENPCLTL